MMVVSGHGLIRKGISRLPVALPTGDAQGKVIIPQKDDDLRPAIPAYCQPTTTHYMKTAKFSWLAAILTAVLPVLLVPGLASAQSHPVTVAVQDDGQGAPIAPAFLGLSYESSMLLPKDGHYYFDAGDQALVNVFQTLGIKSLRVGANAVDDPRIPVPQEPDIDALFQFARAAGVKVIYSFRLKNGNPAEAARLATYIQQHYADLLDCFAVGNEPNFFKVKTYEAFYEQWKPLYDAILAAVPQAKFDGPSADAPYALHLVKDVFPGGHLAMASDHYYFLGSGRAAETNAPMSRARFLDNHLHKSYEKDYANLGALLAAQGVPYRIDEMNSCYNGGAFGSSDTFASALWALDCTHWWAAHHILGVNYHTGELVGRDGKFGPPNYAAFLRQADGQGFAMRPQGYAYLAFTQGAHGRPLAVAIEDPAALNFNAYAFRDADGTFNVTLINKSPGETVSPAEVTVQLPAGTGTGTWSRMDLVQENQDVAAKTEIHLGGAEVDSHGNWTGQWQSVKSDPAAALTVKIKPASAAILRYTPAK